MECKGVRVGSHQPYQLEEGDTGLGHNTHAGRDGHIAVRDVCDRLDVGDGLSARIPQTPGERRYRNGQTERRYRGHARKGQRYCRCADTWSAHRGQQPDRAQQSNPFQHINIGRIDSLYTGAESCPPAWVYPCHRNRHLFTRVPKT
ncbi:Uncharacterised protein [Mycobacteroides abscessus subsp. massiliense]|nr:Uncharacterised protein [Mycobacteroides abscessus subsp. massiliense]